MLRFLTFLVALQLACIGCMQKSDGVNATAATGVDEVNEYPDIILRFHDGSEVAARNLKGKSVLVMFQPDCDHCQEEAVHIEQRLEEFKDYKLYFISSAPMEHIMAFAQNFRLNAKDNVAFAWTATDGVLNSYGPIQTPSIYIYSHKRLKASFNGQTDIQRILNAL